MNRRVLSYHTPDAPARLHAQAIIVALFTIEVVIAVLVSVAITKAHFQGPYLGADWMDSAVLLTTVAIGGLVGLWFCLRQSRLDDLLWRIGVATGCLTSSTALAGWFLL